MTESESIWSTPISAEEIKKFDIVRFKRSHETDWITGEILSRAGKCTGKYKTWWNIKDIETGHQKPEDVQQFESLEKITIEDIITSQDVIKIFYVLITANQPGSRILMLHGACSILRGCLGQHYHIFCNIG